MELLRDEGALTAGTLALHFPEVSRVAVSKHLAVLRTAGLVTSSRRGREQWYAVAPAPLQHVFARWVATFEPVWDHSLPNLKALVEDRREDAPPSAE